jgi:5-methylcytosine-specific restriction enzyme subunit McrC
MSNFQNAEAPVQFTEYGIPIRNLWHMLLYAWNEVPLNALRHAVMEDIEHVPTLDALLASMLTKLMQQRLRIGLGHDYVDEERTLRGIRGRIDFAESLKNLTLERGQMTCEFQRYSANSLKNQIIRSTLARLIKTVQFGPSPARASGHLAPAGSGPERRASVETPIDRRATPEAASRKEIQQKLRQLIRNLDGIDFIELTPELIHRQQLVHHDRDYRLMLAICDLILQRQMPAGPGTRSASAVPALDRDALVLHNVYERFVANFYRIHLAGWNVTAQKRLEWHAKKTNEHLPFMIPDLVLQEKSSGQFIVLDTKFTAHSLIENQWGKPVFDSSHLYQLYAYLKSQEHVSEAHRSASGILLYPAIQTRFSDRIDLQDHTMRIECIVLTAPWQEIESDLIELIYR